MTNPELKPCPWCAGAGEVGEWEWPYVRYQARCSECKATAGGRTVDKGLAIDRWNTRTPDLEASIARLVEALAQIKGGFIPGGATDALLNGDWHPAFSALQAIARQALSDHLQEGK